MVFVAAIFRQVTLLSVLIYGRFLYMRYYISPIVCNVWREFKNFCERKVEGNACDANAKPLPKGVKYAYYGLERFFQDFLFPLERLETKKPAHIPDTPVSTEANENTEQSSAQPDKTK